MSTKSSLSTGPKHHLYREALDDEHIYLELSEVDFEASKDRVTVQIPLEIWMTIKGLGTPDTTLADITDDQLLEQVTQEVQERIAKYNSQLNGQPSFVSLIGLGVYGEVTDPEDQQIQAGMAFYQQRRLKQQEMLARAAEHRSY
ncbi:MAG: hypothetical protein RLZZ156_1679 [Deinococcota bacterium]|jgi:hypothetical protein